MKHCILSVNPIIHTAKTSIHFQPTALIPTDAKDPWNELCSDLDDALEATPAAGATPEMVQMQLATIRQEPCEHGKASI